MSRSSEELLAEHAALIQPFQAFLAERRAELARALATMQAAPGMGPMGATPGAIETPVAPTSPSAPGATVSSAAGTTAGAASVADPVAWLRNPTPQGALAASEPPEVAHAEMGVPEIDEPHPLDVGEMEPDAVTLLAQGTGEMGDEFRRALDETDDAALPTDLQDAMQYGTPEQVAEAFVRAEARDELPDRLAGAVEGMSDAEPWFREASERARDDDPANDPASYF